MVGGGETRLGCAGRTGGERSEPKRSPARRRGVDGASLPSCCAELPPETGGRGFNEQPKYERYNSNLAGRCGQVLGVGGGCALLGLGGVSSGEGSAVAASDRSNSGDRDRSAAKRAKRAWQAEETSPWPCTWCGRVSQVQLSYNGPYDRTAVFEDGIVRVGIPRLRCHCRAAQPDVQTPLAQHSRVLPRRHLNYTRPAPRPGA